MKGMLDPIEEEQIIGHAVIRQTLRHPKVGTIACPIFWTVNSREASKVRITRDRDRYLTWTSGIPEEIQG